MDDLQTLQIEDVQIIFDPQYKGLKKGSVLLTCEDCSEFYEVPAETLLKFAMAYQDRKYAPKENWETTIAEIYEEPVL